MLSLFVLAVFVLGSSCDALSFVPAMDIMTYNGDGELSSIWGEHSFYQDTTAFGHPVTFDHGTFHIGGA